jgi:four helix bundle protein
MDLVVEAYRASASFPKAELYGLRSQLRRAAVSIPANIAEGHGRDGLGDYLYHLSLANGSLMELETHVRIAARMGYLAPAGVDAILARASDVGRMLAGLTSSLRARRGRRRTPGHRTPST